MNEAQHANFYRKLETLVSASIPISACLDKLSEDPSFDSLPLKQAAKQLDRGHPLHIALSKAGLCNAYQKQIISVSEDAGRLSPALKQIADTKEKQASDYKKIKSKLVMPIATLFIAILVQAILRSLQGEAIINTILTTITYLLIALVFTRWLAKLVELEGVKLLDKFTGWKNSHNYQLLYQHIILNLLAWQLSSGISPDKALESISKLFKNRRLSMTLLKAAKACRKGDSLINSLESNQLPLTKEAYLTIRIAEQSGTLESALRHFLNTNLENLDIKREFFIAWLPRFYYFIVVLLVLPVIL